MTNPKNIQKTIKSNPRLRRGLCGMAIILTIFGIWWCLFKQHYESTDNAQIEAHITHVSSRITGQVLRVAVNDNQAVNEGDILVELDARDMRVKLAAASADLAAAKANLKTAQAQLILLDKNIIANLAQAHGGIVQALSNQKTTEAAIIQAQAEVHAAQSRQQFLQSEYQRTQSLFNAGATTAIDLDNKKSQLEQAQFTFSVTQARLAQAESGITQARGNRTIANARLLNAQTGQEQLLVAQSQVELAEAKLKQTSAAFEQAELNLSYATIRSPIKGIVSNRSVEIGQIASPERALMAVTALDHLWVIANFKETQIAQMQPGQKVTIHADALEGQTLIGHVDSLSGASVSRFSLFPPDNASGNFTKVVQRIAVIIQLDSEYNKEGLRPGMNADVSVKIIQEKEKPVHPLSLR